MLLTKDYYRVAFENRLRTNQLGDVDDYNLKLAKLKNNSYPLPYSFKGDYTEHLAHENLFRRFGTVIHTEIEERTVVCMDVMPEPKIVDENQSYPSPHEMRYPCSHTVVISNYINDSTIVFGDLSYYWLIERQPLAVRPLNELYAQESCLGLAASERIDGKLVRSETVKLFKLN